MDEFLKGMRKTPDATYARELYQRVRGHEVAPRRRPAWRSLAVVAGVGVLFVGMVTVPAMSAAAQGFLDLFRVKRITAVGFDASRFDAAQLDKIDPKTLFGAEPVVSRPAGPPQVARDAAEASALAGFSVRLPAAPYGATLQSLRVQGASAASFVPDTNKIDAALQAIGITDVHAPPALNGATIRVSMPPQVQAQYAGGRNGTVTVTVIEMRSPSVELPPGVTMAELGEIGLRLVGMAPADARRFAASIDWNSTLVMPIPSRDASFREVTIKGGSGVLVTPTSEARLPQAALVWSEGDVVYGMTGSLSGDDLLALATLMP